jgi:molybdate transport system substrate-binding protein
MSKHWGHLSQTGEVPYSVLANLIYSLLLDKFGSATALPAQLRRGVPADVVIPNRIELAEQLITEGRTLRGTDVDLAQTYLGVAVHAGAPKPNISTVDAFKQTLLGAKSVTLDSSTSAVYLATKLFPRRRIAETMARKSASAGVVAVAGGDWRWRSCQ